MLWGLWGEGSGKVCCGGGEGERGQFDGRTGEDCVNFAV